MKIKLLEENKVWVIMTCSEVKIVLFTLCFGVASLSYATPCSFIGLNLVCVASAFPLLRSKNGCLTFMLNGQFRLRVLCGKYA